MGLLGCRLKKVTLRGIIVECDHEMEPGNEVCMEITIPGISIEFLGRVIYCNKRPGNGRGGFDYDVRIDYLNIPEKVMAKIKDFVGKGRTEISVQ